MKLVIEIPKERYEKYKRIGNSREIFFEAICKGKPLADVLDKIRAEIEPKCDRINSLASVLPYTAHREIQELLCEIMDLCKAEGGGEDKE